jgi:hypothetical protein
MGKKFVFYRKRLLNLITYLQVVVENFLLKASWEIAQGGKLEISIWSYLVTSARPCGSNSVEVSVDDKVWARLAFVTQVSGDQFLFPTKIMLTFNLNFIKIGGSYLPYSSFVASGNLSQTIFTSASAANGFAWGVLKKPGSKIDTCTPN